MRAIRISKGDGTFRTVWSPSRGERRRLDAALPLIMAAERAAAQAEGTAGCAHGFVAGRSPVTCAREHIGFRVSICCDLAGWFDSVRQIQVEEALSLAGANVSLARTVCWQGYPAQGLPTSPAACNLAAVPMDREIFAGLRRLLGERIRFAYTRYADDLTVSLSSESPALVDAVLALLRRCAETMGWQIAAHKTNVQHRSAGRRVIVGVSVGDSDVKAPRHMRRRLRAARHQDRKSPQARGLAEWCAMKLPRACCSGWRIATGSAAPDDRYTAQAREMGLDLSRADDRAIFCDVLAEDGKDDSALRASLCPPSAASAD